MKKKGFTLVELIAVMAIMSVILVAIGGLYVTGIKRAESTKINGDIENKYRNFYQVTKDSISKNRGNIHLFYNNESKQWWNFYVKAGTNMNFINEGKKDGYSVQKAYLATKNITGDKEKILVSFGNGKVRSFYMIEVNGKDVEYNYDANNNNQGKIDIKGEILSYHKLCDDVTKFNINESNNVYYFYIQYTKKEVIRDYDFSVNETDDRVVTVEDSNNSEDDNNQRGEPYSSKPLDDFYNSIGGITLLNSNNIVLNSSLHFTHSSYYVSGEANGSEDGDRKFESIVQNNSKFWGTVATNNIKNLNNGNMNSIELSLKFKKGFNYTIYDNYIKACIKRMGNYNIILVKNNGQFDLFNNFEEINGGLSQYVLAIIRDENNGHILLTNLSINLDNCTVNNMLIYTSKNINLSSVKCRNSSLVSGGSVYIYGPLSINGEYSKTDTTKFYISKFFE